MALLVLAFAVALDELGAPPPAIGRASRAPGGAGGAGAARAREPVRLQPPGAGLVRARAPDLARARARDRAAALRRRRLRAGARRHRAAIVAVALLVVGVGRFSAAQLSGFVGKVGDVQASAGRLSSPVFPGEALGVWPEGDFRVVRGEVDRRLPGGGAGPAGGGDRRAWRRSAAATSGLVAVGAAAVIVYAARARSPPSTWRRRRSRCWRRWWWSRRWAPCSAPRRPAPASSARYVLGGVVALAMAASTFLALRAAPVGFDQRGEELESLAGLVQGRTVAFLGGRPVRRLLAARDPDPKPRRLRAR